MKKKLVTAPFVLSLLINAFLVLATIPVSAAIKTWDGGGADNNWLTSANWDFDIAPQTNDLLSFGGNLRTAPVNNFPGGTPFNAITFNPGASSFVLSGNSILLSTPTDARGGTVAGGNVVNASDLSQTNNLSMVLAPGRHFLRNEGLGNLRLNGTLTRSLSAGVAFSGGVNVAGSGLSTNASHNILGGWATYWSDWATLDPSGNVVPYTGYADVVGGGIISDNPASNVRITASGGPITLAAGTTRMNSLLYSAGTAAQTIAIGAGNTLVLGANGGIFNATANNGPVRNLLIGASAATGGTLTAGDGVNPAEINLSGAPFGNTGGQMSLNAVIADNGAGVVRVNLLGGYVTPAAANVNTYSGGTYILQGRISQPTSFTFGFGPVYIFPGGQANPGAAANVIITNDFFLAGSGTAENNGMGSLRMFQNTDNNSTLITGTVTLMEDAAVSSNGNASPTRNVGLAGKITGPGGLTIGSPTSTSANGAGGIFTIGPSGGSVTNNYAGDTTISGSAGGAIGSTLRIAPGNNHMMPHGNTGSFNGGKTGNLILNATTSTRPATFDLNGTDQTINGLWSTSVSPENNFVNGSLGNPTLTLGDANADGVFAGTIQDSGATALSLTKIGTGTQIFIGPNTYTGPTTVSGGRLITTTASVATGNYSVAANAILGVRVAGAGTTHAMNNLTVNSGSSLQFDTATLGNPSAAVVNVTGALTISGTVTNILSGSAITPGTFTILTYVAGNRSGGGSFVLKTSPRITATMNDDTVTGIVTVTVTSVESGIRWNGNVTGNWDINNPANATWRGIPSGAATHYLQDVVGSDRVLFDDTASGTTTVNLSSTLTPAALSVSNVALSYTLTGAGSLSVSDVTKNGAGTLRIANSASNDLSGSLLLDNGTVIFDQPVPNTVNALISGTSGVLIKSNLNTLTLSGSNTFDGPLIVAQGTLRLNNSLAMGSTVGGTVISNGATLDLGGTGLAINSLNVGTEAIRASGAGVGGNGAIINSSLAQQNALRSVTLEGHTTFGGPGDATDGVYNPGRWDIRGTGAELKTGGNAYNLTKVGRNQFTLVGVDVDPALADIDVKGGLFAIETTTTSLGNANNNLIIRAGATLQLFQTDNPINKVVTLFGNGLNNTIHVGDGSSSQNIITGPMQLNGNCLVSVNTADFLNFNNLIHGSGSLTKVNVGTLTIAGTNQYSGNTTIAAGTLALVGTADLTNSPVITMAAGSTLDVSLRADARLTLNSGQTLRGSGTIAGELTARPGATVTPGTSAGALIVTGTILLQGTTVMEINKGAATVDFIQGGSITYGGTLMLVNTGTPYAFGDAFKLFDAGAYSGSFTNIQPAVPGPGLLWDTTNLAVDGTLKVFSLQPQITSIAQSGTDVVISGAGGTANAEYYVLASADIGLPVTNWARLATNMFDGSGNFSFVTPIVPGVPQRFYLLQLP